jgi:hypothetical protein
VIVSVEDEFDHWIWFETLQRKWSYGRYGRQIGHWRYRYPVAYAGYDIIRDTGDAHLLHRWPKGRPLHAVIAETLANVELLLGQLECGVRVADNQRDLVRQLYVQTQRQRRPHCGWKNWNERGLATLNGQ